MRIKWQNKYNLIRFTALIMAVLFICPAFFSIRLLADETSSIPSQQEIPGDSGELGNPVNGLLDPEPSGMPEPHADAYLVYDALSDTMLVGKNYDEQMEPANITQIMTVLIALESLELTDQITVVPSMYESIPDEYVRIGFTEGEVITVEECLYACILKSANDACMALAIQISGSEEAFVEKMNSRASELGCTNTHFSNPYGKESFDHYSSCHDLSLILKETLKHSVYIKIATSLSYTIEPTNKYNDKRIMNNGNRFVSTPQIAYENYIGGKTGFADGFGYTIIAGAEKDGKRLIGVLLRASDAEKRYNDLMELLEYCFGKYTTTKIEDSEFLETEKTTLSQIKTALAGTDLTVVSSKIRHLEYYTVPVSLTDSGYSNNVDLSTVVISPNLSEQELLIPIDRVFNENYAFRIGYISIEITNGSIEKKDAETDKKNDGFSILNIIIIVIVCIVLLTVTVISFTLFLKMTRKRKINKNDKNPTVL